MSSTTDWIILIIVILVVFWLLTRRKRDQIVPESKRDQIVPESKRDQIVPESNGSSPLKLSPAQAAQRTSFIKLNWAKTLKTAGYPQISKNYWIDNKYDNKISRELFADPELIALFKVKYSATDDDVYSAFTYEEMDKMLPEKIQYGTQEYYFVMQIFDDVGLETRHAYETKPTEGPPKVLVEIKDELVVAKAKLLDYIATNKLVDPTTRLSTG